MSELSIGQRVTFSFVANIYRLVVVAAALTTIFIVTKYSGMQTANQLARDVMLGYIIIVLPLAMFSILYSIWGERE